MTFTIYPDSGTYTLNKTHTFLDITYLLDKLAFAINSRTINTMHNTSEKRLNVGSATKACNALMKAIYGAAFYFIVRKVNNSIHKSTVGDGGEGEAGGAKRWSLVC